MYQGRDPVNGFYVDIKEGDAPGEAWRGVNTKAAEKTYLKVITCSPFGAFSPKTGLYKLSNLATVSKLCRLRILRKDKHMC